MVADLFYLGSAVCLAIGILFQRLRCTTRERKNGRLRRRTCVLM
jgi:hypothetical protein